MIMKTQQDRSLKRFSGIISSIAFIADIVTVILFLRDIFLGTNSLTFSSISARVTVIIAVFVFAVVLLFYAREEQDNLTGIVIFFAWLYVVLAAVIFGIVSYQFIQIADYSFWEFSGYLFLIILVAGLGFILSQIADSVTKNFSIPFMLVALEQILLWLYKILQWETFKFDWTFLGNLFYFVFAGVLIVVFIYELYDS